MTSIIPYHDWINSQLSIARHYGSIKLNWKIYIVDYIFAEEKDWLCFPDLVEESEYNKMKKANPEKVSAFYEEGKKRKQETNTNEILF